MLLTKDEFMEDFANAKVKEALEAKKAFEAKKVSGAKTEEEKSEEEKSEEILDSWMSRCIQKDNMSVREIKKYVLMYRDLANEDVNGKISVRRMKQFFNELKKNYPDEAYKVELYYDIENGLSTKRKFKLNNAVQAFWNKCRTVENAYKYCHEFHFMANRIASKLDAPEDMGVIERCKWIRLWYFLIKDQNLFWLDIKKYGVVNPEESKRYDREAYLTPETMLNFEEELAGMPDGNILLEMIQSFLNFYPEKVQRDVLRFGELDGKNEPGDLRLGSIRNNLKKKLFPTNWVNGMATFFSNYGIQTMSAKLLMLCLETYKQGNLKEFPIFEQISVDPFNGYKMKKFKCYQIDSEIKEKEGQKVNYIYAVSCKEELDMYVQVYKWLLEHKDVKFGYKDEEKKTLEDYNMMNLLEETPTLEELASEFVLNMSLAFSREDVNLDLAMEIMEPEILQSYQRGEIDGDTVFEKIGFSSELQAKLVCSKRVTLSLPQVFNPNQPLTADEVEAGKMAEALKRVKRFGATTKSDAIYLKLFKYYMSNKKESLPKNMVKLYGKAFL